MRDRRRQPPYRSQTVLHADFALQSPDFRQIIERIYEAQSAPLRYGQSGNQHTESLTVTIRREPSDFTVSRLRTNVRQRIQKKLVDWLAEKTFFRTI